ncbi:zinc ribbon domain-containing protein [Kitasatospora sp. NPDC056531]|uniref:zinc ribbon domain-containing protein n=1 Tax=Kitasatospora sp. NPDC056531 TaxID=3345856 RepID=UPI0036C8294C
MHVREWACPACGVVHDRDLNAARNILAAGQAEHAKIAALIATMVFRERLGRLRLTAALTVLGGIAVLELARP